MVEKKRERKSRFVTVQFIKNFAYYRRGDIVVLPRGIAERLIREGYTISAE